MWDQWRDHDGVDPKVAAEKHQENLPRAVEETLRKYNITKGDKRLEAIAVTIGPGQEKSVNVGIQLAQVNNFLIKTYRGCWKRVWSTSDPNKSY